MPQRVAIVTGQSSVLLYGDPEVEDTRYRTQLSDGSEVDSVLPVLLRENWVINSVTPLNGTALVVLRERKETDATGAPSL